MPELFSALFKYVQLIWKLTDQLSALLADRLAENSQHYETGQDACPFNYQICILALALVVSLLLNKRKIISTRFDFKFFSIKNSLKSKLSALEFLRDL